MYQIDQPKCSVCHQYFKPAEPEESNLCIRWIRQNAVCVIMYQMDPPKCSVCDHVSDGSAKMQCV